MKCARLQLRERIKPKIKLEKSNSIEKPRRYCQKRMVNPGHEEDPRWTDVFERFRCNDDPEQGNFNDTLDSVQAQQDMEDMFLSVQTLKFQGDVKQNKRPKTSFKYKTITDGNKHRMFVKQVVSDNEHNDDGRSSQLTSYYFDDYVKYLFNNDKSRPTSGKSSIFLQGLSDTFKQSKGTQVDIFHVENNKKSRKVEANIKSLYKKSVKNDIKDPINQPEPNIDNTKISFHKAGKRKSLTISRAQSPETVQVIRVDVVCNQSGTAMSDYEDNKKQKNVDIDEANCEDVHLKSSHFANKYLLTSTMKTLDESLSGGAKVTLLCKTFKLSDRSKNPEKSKADMKYLKSLKKGSNNGIKSKTYK